MGRKLLFYLSPLFYRLILIILNCFFRGIGDEEYTELTSDYVTISVIDGEYILRWVGDELSIDPIILEEGDSIRVLYEVIEVPAGSQSLEDFIRSLPLADQRDERDQEYPLKNWNVRLIEEDDPLFPVAIPTRHPFAADVVWGKNQNRIPL